VTTRIPVLQRGFSIVELMVAMTLSLILMAGALSILYSSKLTYNENDRLARLQEAGRAAMEMLLRDSRNAGYAGCTRDSYFTNRLTASTDLLKNFREPVFGFDATGGSWSPTRNATYIPTATAGSDILVLRGARQGSPVFRLLNPVLNSAAPLSVQRPIGATVAPGTPLLISDCTSTTVFGASGFVPAGVNGVILHAAAGGNTNGNLAHTFQIGAQVVPVQTVIYYVDDSPSGVGPALFRKVGAQPAQPMIEGVQNMQVLYGVDTNLDFIVDNYVKASAVTDWAQVIAINLALLIRSEDETNPDIDARDYTLLDEPPVGPFNDRRQRSVFVTTVTLRNRAT
jgi:type IV pilus assembly protein PilW